MVYDCGSCGLERAGAVILTGCDNRACPQCAAQLSRERIDRLAPAFGRVSGYFAARREAAIEALRKACELHKDSELYWLGCGKSQRVTAAKERYKLARWQLERLRENTWGYKLLTISPPWNPSDPTEYTTARIRARIEDCFARWGRIWAKLGCEGLAAAIVSVEVSDGGHIHLHACLWAPYVQESHLAKLAGCFVHIREVKASPNDKILRGLNIEESLYKAIKEAVKYTCKAPSSKQDWVNGARRKVLHPELAVRWVMATKNMQLGRTYGLMKDAMKAERAANAGDAAQAQADNQSGLQCPHCRTPLTGFPRVENTRELAKALTEWEWKHRVKWRRLSGRLLTPQQIASEVSRTKREEKPERMPDGRTVFGEVFHPRPRPRGGSVSQC
jgi:hypothetical protein